MTIPTLGTFSGRKLITDLQSFGLQIDEQSSGMTRKGGAGPSDHKTITIAGQTVMVPVYTSGAQRSPFQASPPDRSGTSTLLRDGQTLGTIHFPAAPRFYGLSTADGIPYWKIALLHGRDTLATTVHQTCIRYADRRTSCQFCAIGQSLEAERTIAYKTPAQLAEVAKAAVELDGVRDMVLTTGTPNVIDRGAAVLADSARAIRAAVDLPLQVQCEPPRDHGWFQRLREAGADSLGMHLEAATQAVREKIMPGKATVSVDRYMEAFASAVPVFGRGQVNTYILAGLGDSAEDILGLAERLIALGVYPFVVPFVPISGTPLENHAPPTADFMKSVLAPLGRMLRDANMKSTDIRAGCGRCGACSSLSAYEQ
ncbi:MAG: MSMEG_0568 family radical SAM protein [Acetobacter fabarum]|jgi:radical SAM protein (TIGR04043 family)|uniref:MSMEG_0568 family radical SAM protein n=1 Tax=Acetobacter fabarum TaxID=483199 RepID=UPI00242D920A|nr:MSMEG_0568 family radical SAM protein [Acetobacter fabarum]MCH4026496.1 MSMEG_0568 family radical SAM protein [Acetobacter fabarum]MCH4085642.1 MSMEG_0568 family radical SAM protein [Acetobacter fabarum]MCH4137115.1 MSMEG_0568 family radical SAM protein [Acetobacter fabarum]MCI1322384.1 MSMEG_0568 family radical SAM protein [Acetobacter fabarum]